LVDWLGCPRDWGPKLWSFAGVSSLSHQGLRAARRVLGSGGHVDRVQSRSNAISEV
jgi:hypothetical protein